MWAKGLHWLFCWWLAFRPMEFITNKLWVVWLPVNNVSTVWSLFGLSCVCVCAVPCNTYCYQTDDLWLMQVLQVLQGIWNMIVCLFDVHCCLRTRIWPIRKYIINFDNISDINVWQVSRDVRPHSLTCTVVNLILRSFVALQKLHTWWQWWSGNVWVLRCK